MSDNTGNKQQNGQKEDKKTEETKDWMEYINDFIKNPITTGVTGLAAGYLLGTYKASKDIEAIKEEHKQQMKERDDQFKQLLKQIQITNKMIGSKTKQTLQLGEDDEDENTLQMVEDEKSKAYKYQSKKKHFKLQG